MAQEHNNVEEGAEETNRGTERRADIGSAARCAFSNRLGQRFRAARSYIRSQAGYTPPPSRITPDMARVMDQNENHWLTALSLICVILIVSSLFLLVEFEFIRARLDSLKDAVEGNATFRDDSGVIQHFVADKIPSNMRMVANPCTCLGNGTVSLIRKTDVGLCTNETWWKSTPEDGQLAMTLEQMYGLDSFARFIVVAATYVCGDDPTCFKRVTAAALTTEEAMTEMMCFVRKSTETGECKGPDRQYWVAFGKMGSSLSSPLAMLVAVFNRKAKQDIADGVFQRVPFKRMCSNTITNPLYVFVCREHRKRQHI